MLARETGCTFGFGMFQMGFVPGLFRQAAALAHAPIGEVIPSDHGAFAMGLAAHRRRRRDLAVERRADSLRACDRAPLALGNTVVLKPSEWSPQVGGLLWGEVLADAGFTAGVLNIVARARRGAADRRRAGRETARAAPQLHRLDRHRPQARRGGRPQPEASCSSSAGVTR